MQPHPIVIAWEVEQRHAELMLSARRFRVATEPAHGRRLADGVHGCMATVRRVILRRPVLPPDHTLTTPKRA